MNDEARRPNVALGTLEIHSPLIRCAHSSCIWKAISYCAMRVAISGSSHSAACCLLSALIARDFLLCLAVAAPTALRAGDRDR